MPNIFIGSYFFQHCYGLEWMNWDSNSEYTSYQNDGQRLRSLLTNFMVGSRLWIQLKMENVYVQIWIPNVDLLAHIYPTYAELPLPKYNNHSKLPGWILALNDTNLASGKLNWAIHSNFLLTFRKSMKYLCGFSGPISQPGIYPEEILRTLQFWQWTWSLNLSVENYEPRVNKSLCFKICAWSHTNALSN